jgi:hypothetical protein
MIPNCGNVIKIPFGVVVGCTRQDRHIAHRYSLNPIISAHCGRWSKSFLGRRCRPFWCGITRTQAQLSGNVNIHYNIDLVTLMAPDQL